MCGNPRHQLPRAFQMWANSLDDVPRDGLADRLTVMLDVHLAKHPRCSCIGGHLTEPYEQKTQQSPLSGRSKALQLSHS